MTTDDFKREFWLPTLHRWLAIIVGLILVGLGAWLYLCPPKRETIELVEKPGNVTEVQKATFVHSDPTALVIAALTAGSALIVYGLNGIRIVRLSMSSVTLQSLEGAGQAAENSQAGALASSSASVSVLMRDFLLRSSWNGLLLLKACQIAAHNKKTFNLRVLAGNLNVSFDYMFGFLIASQSAGALLGTSDPNTSSVTVEALEATVEKDLNKTIDGNIALPNQANLAQMKRVQISAIENYFRGL